MSNICTCDYSLTIETMVLQVPYVTVFSFGSIFVYEHSGVCVHTHVNTHSHTQLHNKENDIWYRGGGCRGEGAKDWEKRQ